jgi:antitoxin FitA
MAILTVRGIDDDLKALLRVRAAENGRSMEAEVRDILRTSLTRPAAGTGLGTRIHRRFAGSAVDELALPSRTEPPRAAEFGE